MDKLDEVLSLDWSDKEREHMLLLKSFINENTLFFDYDLDEDTRSTLMDSFEIYMYRWSEYAKTDLNWNMQQLYAIVATGHKLKNKAGELLISYNAPILIKTRSESGGPNYCACSSANDWCDPTGEMRNYCSTKVKCEHKPNSCGWFFQFTCDGGCRGIGTGD